MLDLEKLECKFIIPAKYESILDKMISIKDSKIR